MAAGEAGLSREEKLALLRLDLAEVADKVEQMCEALATSEAASDMHRIGSTALGLMTTLPAEGIAMVAAVAMEKLNQERGRYS